MAARWDPLKDFETALAAAAVLMARHADLHVLMCGNGVDGDNTELRKLAAESGCGERLHLMGRRDDMPAWQAALDVAFLASHTEGLPNTVGEAMACGVPCVVTDAGGSTQLVGPVGRVVRVEGAGELAGGIDEFLQMTAVERRRIGDAGDGGSSRNSAWSGWSDVSSGCGMTCWASRPGRTKTIGDIRTPSTP